ncbi:DUF3098 domain-containing protein [uncultured Rikenella sp.]|uniref:DUF3098 domain-containing protein n=1 Tax=uncultured Rikenella sp. TaxID=368003 RepID=UPI0025D959B9|nr:DUF3098 domain-containing protein [uncultured Rikenella sp.]
MKKQTPAHRPATGATMPFNRRNYILMLAGIGAIILGFILLSGGASDNPAAEFNHDMFIFRRLYLAPLLLLAGFLFEIYAIMYRPKTKESDTDETATPKSRS